MANVLVTGGADYVGCHVLGPLKEAAHHPVEFDDLRRGFAELVHSHGAHLHFTALADDGKSTGSPLRYYRTNTADALGFLKQMIPHHRMGVMMASHAQWNTIHSELRQLEAATVPVQSQEIEQMEQ